MLRSLGVHDPQRVDWFVTHRTVAGRALPSRKRSDSSAARVVSSSSLRGPPRRERSRSRRSTIRSTHTFSSAFVNRAGMATTAVPPSQNALTVLRRRAERRTSTGGGEPEDRVGTGWEISGTTQQLQDRVAVPFELRLANARDLGEILETPRPRLCDCCQRRIREHDEGRDIRLPSLLKPPCAQ